MLIAFQSSECNVWFDGASKKRKRDFEREQISKLVKTLEDRNRNESKWTRHLYPSLQVRSGLSSDEEIENLEHYDSEKTSIRAFKRIRFDRGVQALGIEELIKLIDSKLDQILNAELRVEFSFQPTSPKRRKRAGELTQEELYKVKQALLSKLKASSEYLKAFLRSLKRNGPNLRPSKSFEAGISPISQVGPRRPVPHGILRVLFLHSNFVHTLDVDIRYTCAN